MGRPKRAVAKKNQALADKAKNMPGSESKDKDEAVNITNKDKAGKVASDKVSSKSKRQKNTEEETGSRKKLPENEKTENSRSLSENASNTSVTTEKELSSSSPKKQSLHIDSTHHSEKSTDENNKSAYGSKNSKGKEKSISSSPNMNDSVESKKRDVGSPARFSKSCDEELSAIKGVINKTLSLDADKTEPTTLWGEKAPEDGDSEKEVRKSPGKKKTVKVSNRAKPSTKQVDATDSESNNKEIYNKSSKEKPLKPKKRKLRAKNSQLNASASEDSDVEEEVSECSGNNDDQKEVGKSPGKKKTVKVSKRAKPSTKKVDATDSESNNKEIYNKSSKEKPSKPKKKKPRAKNRQLNASASEDSDVEEEVGESSGDSDDQKEAAKFPCKNKTVKVSKRAKPSTKQVDATDSESNDKEISNKSNEKERSLPMKRKGRARNSQLNASEDGEPPGQKEPVKASKRIKISTKQLDETASVSKQKSDKEIQSSKSEASWCSASSTEEEEEETLTTPFAKSKNEYPCFACQKVFNKTQDLFNHTCTIKKVKGFMCKVCKKVYSQRSSYVNHEITHSSRKPYKCGHCGNRSNNQSNHISHMKRFHPESKLFPCCFLKCKRSFSTRKKMLYHYKTIHNANKCKYCDENFDTNFKMLRHRYNEHERYLIKE